MFALEAGEANVRLHRVASPAEAFRRIEQGEDGLFLAGEVLVDSRGFVRKGQDGAGVSIREFREKMKLESELAQIEEELRTKTAKLSELQVSQKELESARAASGEKRRSREGALAALEREYIDVGVQVRTVKERLTGRGLLPIEPAPEDEDAAFFCRTCRGKGIMRGGKGQDRAGARRSEGPARGGERRRMARRTGSFTRLPSPSKG